MREMNSTEFQAVKDWYKEWVRFPQYSITAALAILAFSLTNFVLKHDGTVIHLDTTYLRLSWMLLGVSTFLSSIGMFAAYSAFDIGARVHLRELLQSLHMNPPPSDTPWVRRLSKAAWVLTLLGMLLMLTGTYSLVVFTLRSLG